MTVNTSVQIRKFYAAANSILHNTTHVSEVVRLSLVESYALPMLTYACETHNVPRRCVICLCAGITYVRLRKLSFWSKVRSTENRVLFECGRILRYTNCFNSVCLEYDIQVDNFPAQYHVKQIV